MSKKITVFSTGGKSGISIDTEAKTWKELRNELSKQGVTTSGMKAVIGKSKLGFEHDESAVPDEDFTLFMLPVQTKSGYDLPKASEIEGMSFGSVRTLLKEIQAADGEAFKAHFGNYTQLSTADLKAKLISYKKPKGGSSSASKPEAKAVPAKTAPAKGKEGKTAAKGGNVGEVVKSVAASKSKSTDKGVTRVAKSEENSSLDDAIAIIKAHPGNSKLKDDIIRSISGLKAGEDPGAIDNDALLREARELAKGIPGVKTNF